MSTFSYDLRERVAQSIQRTAILTIVATVLFSSALFQRSLAADAIDLYRPESIAAHSPVLIAHRGGVVEGDVPENSLRALQLASQRGYAMVEVDIRRSADGVPVAFHDDELLEHVGVEGRIEDLSFYEIRKLRYLEGDRVLSLDEYLREAARLNMGIMLDIKTDGDETFFNEVRDQLQRYGLSPHTLTISRRPNAINYLDDAVMHRLSDQQVEAVAAGEAPDLRGTFWFGWPRYIDNEMVSKLQKLGALIVPSINVFHYPDEEHLARAKADIDRMKAAGVRFYQIDSVYDRFVLE